MVKAVVFDLFETLVTESGTQPTRASRLGGALGLEDAAFRVEWKARRPRIVLGHLSFHEALTEISRTLIGRVDTVAVARACEERVREKSIAFAAIDEDVVALVSELRGRGLRLAVISNCFAEDVRSWPTWPLACEFQCSVFSCVAGLAKPDPEIYVKATRGLGVEPDAAVFIGDGGDGELVGAGRAGLRAFRADWFSSRWPHVRSSDSGVGLANPREVLSLVTTV
jgi:HAD superfamily hydrolase (TIGR01509 family)